MHFLHCHGKPDAPAMTALAASSGDFAHLQGLRSSSLQRRRPDGAASTQAARLWTSVLIQTPVHVIASASPVAILLPSDVHPTCVLALRACSEEVCCCACRWGGAESQSCRWRSPKHRQHQQ